jgi:DNA-binding phage protein
MQTVSVNVIELKKMMLDKGFERITDLSEATGINRNTLGKVLSGNAQPSSRTMIELKSILEMTSKQAGEIFFNSNLRNA